MPRFGSLINRFIRSRLAIAVTTAVLATGIAGTVAVASIPDTGGQFHGCYNNKTGALRVIDPSKSGTQGNCVTSPASQAETGITWNQTGPQGLAGPVGPAGPQGPKGDTGATGAMGATGPTGPTGANGNTVLNGTGNPPSTTGNVGDFYVDTAATVLWGPKTASGWPASGVSLIGPQGQTGPQGTPGTPGPAGPAGPSTAGPSGLDTTVVSNTSPGQLTTVRCPADHPYLTGGGGTGSVGYPLVSSEPVAADQFNQAGWFVYAPQAQNAQGVAAYAICGK